MSKATIEKEMENTSCFVLEPCRHYNINKPCQFEKGLFGCTKNGNCPKQDKILEVADAIKSRKLTAIDAEYKAV